MPTLHLPVGLPGTGKTTLARDLETRHAILEHELLDQLKRKIVDHFAYNREFSDDLPEDKDWRWMGQ